jgi:SCY1-like protein 2
VWSFDKRGTNIERQSPLARERTIEVLKAEVEQSLTISASFTQCIDFRPLRSAGSVILPSWASAFFNVRDLPIFLPLSSEMVEPLEETRSELVFATEPILSSLELAIQDSGKNSGLVDLDEVEVHTLFEELW